MMLELVQQRRYGTDAVINLSGMRLNATLSFLTARLPFGRKRRITQCFPSCSAGKLDRLAILAGHFKLCRQSVGLIKFVVSGHPGHSMLACVCLTHLHDLVWLRYASHRLTSDCSIICSPSVPPRNRLRTS